MKIIKNYLFAIAIISFISCDKKEAPQEEKPNGDNDYIKDLVNLEITEGAHGIIKRTDVNEEKIFIELNGVFPASTPAKRHFAYYIPKNLGNNYSLLFELHGNFSIASGMRVALNFDSNMKTIADTSNIVIIAPVGSHNVANNWGWHTYNNDQAFLDTLINLFKRQIKIKRGFDMDMGAIYSTGTSSGGIFSWQLAYIRSETYAAVIPRYGSVRNTDDVLDNPPTYKVPMLIIAGTEDTYALPSAIIKNANKAAQKIYGLMEEPILDTIRNFNWTKSPYIAGTTDVYRQRFSEKEGRTWIETLLIQGAYHSELKYGDLCPKMFQFLKDNKRK